MYNTIVKQATSMEWVFLRIKTAFRIQSRGIDLYTATVAGYDEDKNPSYAEEIDYFIVHDSACNIEHQTFHNEEKYGQILLKCVGRFFVDSC